MAKKNKTPPVYDHVDSDEDSVPPPPPLPPSPDAFQDHEQNASANPKKWNLFKKENEHTLVPQNDPSSNSDVAMQGHFRGIHNAQKFDEEEAGMDEIEVPSSSVVARLNNSEVSSAKKRKFYKMGMLAGLAVVVLIAVVTGSVLGTRGGGGGGDNNVANVGDGNAEQDVGGGNDEQNVGGGNNEENVGGGNDEQQDLGEGNDEDNNEDPVVIVPNTQTAAGTFLLADPTIPDSVKTSLDDPDSAGAQALEWVLNDPMNAEFPFADAASFEDEKVQFDFKQRLGAAAIAKAFNLGDGFASEKDVCEWEGIVCGGGGVPVDEGVDEANGEGGVDVTNDEGGVDEANDEGENRNLQDSIPANAITRIDMREQLIEGTIPVEITLFNSLSQIILYSNKLQGPIPPELGSMPILSAVDLYDNELTGEIPPELFSENMVGLYLSKNNLNGQLPDVSQMTQLKMIWLDDNDFTGPIPTEFGALSELEMLLLSDNDFTGGIPAELGDLEALRVLNLSNCKLELEIPAELAGALSLEELYLSGNFLEGEIPVAFQLLENLKIFEFEDNFNIYRVPNRMCRLRNRGLLETLLGGCEIQECACCTDVCGQQ